MLTWSTEQGWGLPWLRRKITLRCLPLFSFLLLGRNWSKVCQQCSHNSGSSPKMRWEAELDPACVRTLPLTVALHQMVSKPRGCYRCSCCKMGDGSVGGRAGQRELQSFPLSSTATLHREDETDPRKFVHGAVAVGWVTRAWGAFFQGGFLLAQGFWMLHFLKKC